LPKRMVQRGYGKTPYERSQYFAAADARNGKGMIRNEIKNGDQGATSEKAAIRERYLTWLALTEGIAMNLFGQHRQIPKKKRGSTGVGELPGGARGNAAREAGFEK